MGNILIVTKSTDVKAKIINCVDEIEAINTMKNMYNKICKNQSYDYNNTYIDEDLGYAQIVFGFEQIEFRISKLSFM